MVTTRAMVLREQARQAEETRQDQGSGSDRSQDDSDSGESAGNSHHSEGGGLEQDDGGSGDAEDEDGDGEGDGGGGGGGGGEDEGDGEAEAARRRPWRVWVWCALGLGLSLCKLHVIPRERPGSAPAPAWDLAPPCHVATNPNQIAPCIQLANTTRLLALPFDQLLETLRSAAPSLPTPPPATLLPVDSALDAAFSHAQSLQDQLDILRPHFLPWTRPFALLAPLRAVSTRYDACHAPSALLRRVSCHLSPPPPVVPLRAFLPALLEDWHLRLSLERPRYLAEREELRRLDRTLNAVASAVTAALEATSPRSSTAQPALVYLRRAESRLLALRAASHIVHRRLDAAIAHETALQRRFAAAAAAIIHPLLCLPPDHPMPTDLAAVASAIQTYPQLLDLPVEAAAARVYHNLTALGRAVRQAVEHEGNGEHLASAVADATYFGARDWALQTFDHCIDERAQVPCRRQPQPFDMATTSDSSHVSPVPEHPTGDFKGMGCTTHPQLFLRHWYSTTSDADAFDPQWPSLPFLHERVGLLDPKRRGKVRCSATSASHPSTSWRREGLWEVRARWAQHQG
ncbi:hypothetical protein M409DRAFT_29501 [Zasmidium cellare ATCC 36951]|uniref:Uncharacterized protein n=1 Tax=Zasmidium cellare ATCC 36951 TaxID=1080233 RepID=A0A6A6BZ35_ZASCE|nr:uncharacterized protein M409DRAFT_29501 [Zasmidium cellare ATCC 36951]KAF2160051.1 hypothetical protein M409DRAFT_29501 [Zasmidium cellare ATCC 36951]